jgi:hypothetical protein
MGTGASKNVVAKGKIIPPVENLNAALLSSASYAEHNVD